MTPTRSASARPLAAVAAQRVAPAALEWLRSGRPGRVLHVFERAAYLVNDRGGILLLAAPPVGPGPFSLQIDGPDDPLTDRLSVDDPALVRGGDLSAGRISVNLEKAVVWQPSPDWEAIQQRSAAWSPHLTAVRLTLRQHSRHGIFAGLIEDTQASSAGSIADHLAHVAHEAAEQLLETLGTGDEDRLTQSALGLAGLGSGFTPSGDDFLMGTMFALRAVRPPADAQQRSRWLSQAAAQQTTRASAAWMAAAAHGEAAEPWHLLFDSFVADPVEEVQAAARRILRTGHTSGEDALIGFVRAAESLLGASPP